MDASGGGAWDLGRVVGALAEDMRVVHAPSHATSDRSQKIFKALVLKEKAAIQARLGLEGKSIPLLGRMTETARREDDKVERMLDWRKVSGERGAGREGRRKAFHGDKFRV
jgi:hypothetical protein